MKAPSVVAVSGLVKALAIKHWCKLPPHVKGFVDVEDFMQEGFTYVYFRYKKYNSRRRQRKAKFTTYIWTALTHHYFDYSRQLVLKNPVVSVGDDMLANAADPLPKVTLLATCSMLGRLRPTIRKSASPDLISTFDRLSRTDRLKLTRRQIKSLRQELFSMCERYNISLGELLYILLTGMEG